MVFGPEHVALFSTRASLSELDGLCANGQQVLYDAGGWQAPAREFAFVGARITAVQSKADGALSADAAPDLWIAEGDSLRLDDGQPVPRTLGELRERYGRVIADVVDASGADDTPEPGAISCRFPYIEFKLGFASIGAIPDSTHIIRLEMWIPPHSGADHVCGP